MNNYFLKGNEVQSLLITPPFLHPALALFLSLFLYCKIITMFCAMFPYSLSLSFQNLRLLVLSCIQRLCQFHTPKQNLQIMITSVIHLYLFLNHCVLCFICCRLLILHIYITIQQKKGGFAPLNLGLFLFCEELQNFPIPILKYPRSIQFIQSCTCL